MISNSFRSLCYRKYIIAIIGDPRMLETEGCAPVIAQRENLHPQSYRPWANNPGRFRTDHRIKFGRSFSYLRHSSSLPSPRLFVERLAALWSVSQMFRRYGWNTRWTRIYRNRCGKPGIT
jgi:hypothetical protein